DAVEAPDDRTITIHWKQPFIDGDTLFASRAGPLPRHLLEEAYAGDKSAFTALPYWTADFVGTGPFRVVEWAPGSQVTLAANPDPPALANVQFRRALMHAIDRQQLADAFQGGLGPVANSLLNPGQPKYAQIETNVPRYGYDPRKASELFAGLGFTRRSDGKLA